MTPEFSQAVDPVFLHVLRVQDRIGLGEEPDPRTERDQIRNLLDRAESRLGKRDDWQLAKYAIVSWIDDVLIDAPWNGRAWWNENKMEWECFRTNDRALEFFVRANKASALPVKDALEVFYVSVVLGFRGIYRDPNAVAAVAESLQLAPDLESWARQIGSSVRFGAGRPELGGSTREIAGAPPLEGPATLIWSVFFGVAVAVLGALFVWLFMIST